MPLPSSGSPQERASFVSRNAWTPYVLITLTVVIFAGGYIVGRAVHEIFPPAGLTFWRHVLAVLVLLPFVYRQVHQQAPLALRHWKLMLIIGVTNAVTGQALLYLALHTTTAINVGLINAMQPAIIMVIAWLLLRDPISLRHGIGTGIGFAGVAVIISRGSVEQLIALDFVIGDMWFLVSLVSFALYAVLIKRVPPGFSALGLLQAINVASLVLLVPLYAAELLFTDQRAAFNMATVSTVLYTGVVVSILAIICLNTSIKHIGPGRAGSFFYLMPVFTAILAVALLGETLQLYHFVGMVLVLAGVSLVSRAPRPRSR